MEGLPTGRALNYGRRMVVHEALLAFVSLAAVAFMAWVAVACARSLPKAWRHGEIRTGWAFGSTVLRQDAPLQFWWLFTPNVSGVLLCTGGALVILLAILAQIVIDLRTAA